MSKTKLASVGIFLCVLGVESVAAQSIPNWPAPPSWSPRSAQGMGRLSPMDLTNPLPFIAVTPCRVADTRGNGFTGSYGPPALAANATRSFTIAGQCGLSGTAAAVSFNFTALNVVGAGDLRVFPAGAGVPLVSTLNYNANTPNIANAAVVPLGTAGAITVQADAVSIDLIIDVNGYYYDQARSNHSLTSGERFALEGAINGSGIFYGLNDSTGSSADGGLFVTVSGAANAAGVVGENIAGSGRPSGVWGVTLSPDLDAAGVRGWALPPNTGSLTFGRAGVRGESDSGLGLLGLSNFIGADGFLVDGSGNPVASGLLGSSLNSRTSGVLGYLYTGAGDTAGVLGINGTGTLVSLPTGFSTAGVRGEGDQGTGVLGLSRSNGVVGNVYDSSGILHASGMLGTLTGFYYAVLANGDLGTTGAKNFVEPHPTDASKVIVYSSLESREVGTYFRGTARAEGGRAVIELPEDFRIVTDEEGLTVQLTPIRSFASMYVESEDLNQIVVRSSRDVTFHYLVQGVRRAFKDFRPVRNGEEFMPPSAASRMPGYLTDEARRRLIANGTYNPDGTVNLETAERAGWARIWREREEQVKAAEERARAAAGPKK